MVLLRVVLLFLLFLLWMIVVVDVVVIVVPMAMNLWPASRQSASQQFKALRGPSYGGLFTPKASDQGPRTTCNVQGPKANDQGPSGNGRLLQCHPVR